MDNDDIELKYEKEKKALKVKFVFLLIIVAIISAVFGSELTLNLQNKTAIIDKENASEDATKNIDKIATNLKRFRKIIDEYYIGDIDEQKVIDETIKGYVNGLDDEYSEYMTQKEWDEFQASALGNYVGIGIYMTVDKNDNVVVLSSIKDTPAEKAGLETGDIIVKVNDENVLGVSSDIVASKIKGEEGTKVKITVLREDEYKDFEITREAIKVYHVESKMLEDNIGYIQLIAFDEGCAQEIENAYKDIKSKGAQKIILDLRDNTGGIVSECLEIADMIIPEGKKLMITVDAKDNKEIDSSKLKPLITEDMVVLVNEYSASASEILTGALKDNDRAKVVGTKTYGKGVIQSILPLNDGSVLKLTVNEYYTPNETKINKVGIEPDYSIEDNKDTEEDEQLNKAIELLK